MPTPHIESNPNDIAKVVIMPGDPKRAEYIARKYLKNAKLVNSIRGMTAYTGYYEEKEITVFPSGMGIPSMGIYAYELFNNYNVESIIRIGTIGAYNPNLKLGDIILAKRAYSDSNFAKIQTDYEKNYLDSDEELNKLIEETSNENNCNIIKGNIFTSDVFYEKKDYKQKVIDYEVPKISNKKATSILTVVNSFSYTEELTSEEREKKLDKMITLALKTSLKI